ncbi:hypothetical protein HY493_03965 [Candidatus Woesearchaeota archaeon]|nr:hypothetical protein [Candidatus Woesearchaeota archaeon]
MQESLFNAKAELKRADHLISVSLKYTRTVDVIKHIVQRLISSIDFGLEVLLKHAKAKKRLAVVPTLPRIKLEQARELYGDNADIQHFLDLYVFLKKVDKARFDRSQEFRRHVTMTAHIDTGEKVEVNIDIITDYFEKVTQFIALIEKMVTETP